MTIDPTILYAHIGAITCSLLAILVFGLTWLEVRK